MHDFDKDPEGLLLRHLEQKGCDEEALSLAISDLGVIDGVCLGDSVERFLSHAPRFLEELVGGEGAVDVAQDHLLIRRLFCGQDSGNQKKDSGELSSPSFVFSSTCRSQ